MVIVVKIDSEIKVQIRDEAVCISHRANTLGNDLNPAMGKYLGKLGCLTLIWQPVKEKENSEFKPIKLHLKIDLVSRPANAEGLINKYIVYVYQVCWSGIGFSVNV